MGIHVFSEIQPLKKVLLHRPGKELEHLSPHTLGRLLFDDIPFLDMAKREHDYFAELLTANGVEVVYLEDLVAETLADEALRRRFVEEFIEDAGDAARYYKAELAEMLLAVPDIKEMVLWTMAGVNITELQAGARGPLVSLTRHDSHFVLDPIPNLYFTRDPFAAIGRGVSLHRMFSKTRQRETIYGRYILDHHPDFGDTTFYYRPDAPFNIEGGDLLVLGEGTLAVGISQRTSAEAIELLARNLFADERSSFDTILALDIPNYRAFMHLDTIFTQVDADKFTIHSAVVSQTMTVYKLEKKGSGGDFTVRDTSGGLDRQLAKVMRVDGVKLIPCGGNDFVASEREQWNDGANTLCLAPGTVLVYNRNSVTNRMLRDEGVTVLEMPSSELSRGRGGPRCMSMPLVRMPQ